MSIKQLNRISIIWGTFLVIIVVLLTIFGFVYKSKTAEYKKLEEELVSAGEAYADAKFLYPQEVETVQITLDELKANEVLEELKKGDDVCDGYVSLTYDGRTYQFKGYIKCPKYTTKGY